ncbi:hypothetical protein BDV95DRAFT_662472 [Massariosphaeria phaeospora]|uniref:Major facilitator superfamily transporter n=1 Tax=Massariosphaeria phaeospora TaxID=100035 RepID=A0A7C8I7Q7_9PLEO|nr:hypothetical protein BDV95DRAFT_662472 [Massariosphaeria phaeospora]
MLGLSVAKRKYKQPYNQVPVYDEEDARYGEKRWRDSVDGDGDGDEEEWESDDGEADRERVGILQERRRDHNARLDHNAYNDYNARFDHNARNARLAPLGSPGIKPTVSAYSYRNPRAFTRYFGLAVGSTLVLFVLFLTKASWTSIRSAELGLHKQPPPPPVWESFPFLKRYHGGIRTLTSREKNVPEYPRTQDVDPEMPAVELQKDAAKQKRMEGGKLPDSEAFDPYPDYQSSKYVERYGPVETCYLDDEDTVQVPTLRAYKGVMEGTPDNVMGSYELLGLRNDVCFERFGRLGPYGLGYSKKMGGTGAAMEGDREGAEQVWEQRSEVDYREVKWGKVVERCLEKNDGRFKPVPRGRNHFFQTMGTKGPDDEPLGAKASEKTSRDDTNDETVSTNGTVGEQPKAEHKELLPRTAVLIRTWWDYEYDDEDIMYLRALISELSVASGGEHVVHFLIHVKDDNKQIWGDEEIYQEVLKKSLPAEFEGMGTLWSERQMGLIYGGLEESMYRNLPVHGAYRSTFMPVTYFAHQHPEFDYFWHWEMDVRYTGHFYHLFTQVSQWAEKQPRKYLWERNARFYVPSVHESWDDFSHMVRVQTEHGTNSKSNTWSSHLPPNPAMPDTSTQKPEKPIWGPHPPLDYPDIEIDDALRPNMSFAEDKTYAWGVGEPADLIVFNPLFDPQHTNWILADDVTGYNRTQGAPPRRVAINTSSRLSARLLATMHREQLRHRHSMFSEMWPASAALHHGFKAVYAPHPVFIDRRWPTQYLAAIFNNGRNGASGGARLSVFSDERQHNFLGTTWYYHAGFAPNLWKRWLGYRVDGDGGERWEVGEEGKGGKVGEGGEGRICLPGMLLHPVKQVDLVVEGGGGEEEGKEE